MFLTKLLSKKPHGVPSSLGQNSFLRNDNLNGYDDRGHICHLGNQTLQDLCLYWEVLRRNRLTPAPKDLNVIEIPHLLPHLMLFSVGENPMSIFCESVGSAISEQVGENLTDAPVFPQQSNTPGNQSQTWARTCLTSELLLTAIQKKPHYAKCGYHDEEMRFSSVQRLVVPFSNDGNIVSLLVAGVIFDAVHPLDNSINLAPENVS